jgi:hypothetical protein
MFYGAVEEFLCSSKGCVTVFLSLSKNKEIERKYSLISNDIQATVTHDFFDVTLAMCYN